MTRSSTATSKPTLKSSAPDLRSLVHLHRGHATANAVVLAIDSADGTLTLAADVPGSGWSIIAGVAPRTGDAARIGWSYPPAVDTAIRQPREGDEVVYMTGSEDRQNPLLDRENAIVAKIGPDGTLDLDLTDRSVFLGRRGVLIEDQAVARATPGAEYRPWIEPGVPRGTGSRCWEYASDVPAGPLVDPGKARATPGAMLMRSVDEQVSLDNQVAAAASELEASKLLAAETKANMLRGGDVSRGAFSSQR